MLNLPFTLYVMPRTLKHPPLREVVLQVDFKSDPTTFLSLFESFYSRNMDRFPQRTRLERVQASITPQKENPQSNISSQHVGYRLESLEGNLVVLVSMDAIGVSFLNKSYTSWNDFYPCCKLIIEDILNSVEFSSLSRVSLRYINELTFGKEDVFEDLILLINHPYEGIGLINAHAKLNLQSEQNECQATVQQIFQGKDDELLFVFDIDVFTEIKSLENMDQKCSILREFKNELFFNSVGKKLLEKFD
jgi:uncharacterized protein (TIGR04255 family)